MSTRLQVEPGAAPPARRRVRRRRLAAVVVGAVAAAAVAVLVVVGLLGHAGPSGRSPQQQPSVGPSAEVGSSGLTPLSLQGFARGTTGGQGGRLVSVTSLADNGPGSLRAALGRQGPTWVRFAVSGEIVLASPVRVPSDVTIDGRGADVTIRNKGLVLDGVHNVVVENLQFTAIRGATSDAISLRDHTSGVWIDHSTFSDGRDGLVDITYGATDVTVSWCHFLRHDKVMLIAVLKGTGAMRVTVHHSWFDHTTQRNPLVRGAYAHVFDNYVVGWTGYGMQAQAGGDLFAQDNVLAASPGSSRVDAIRSRDGKYGAGSVLAEGNVLLDGARKADRPGGSVASVPYPYALQPAGPALVRAITSGAGWQRYPTTSIPTPLPLG